MKVVMSRKIGENILLALSDVVDETITRKIKIGDKVYSNFHEPTDLGRRVGIVLRGVNEPSDYFVDKEIEFLE